MALVVYENRDELLERNSISIVGGDDTDVCIIESEAENDDRSIVEDSNRIESSISVAADAENVTDVSLVGRTFVSEDDAWEAYKMYAKTVGFGIKRFRTHYSKSGTLVSKSFTCNKQGLKYNGVVKDKCYKKLDSRSDCGAQIKFTITEDGLWIVNRHDTAHNHELIKPDQVHLLRSSRKMPENDIRFLSTVKDSGIGVTRGYALLKDQAHGSRNLGYTKRDALNNVAAVQKFFWSSGDANGLLELLRMRQEQDSGFFYHFDVDDEGRLCSVFWRDSRMRMDYEAFGDLVVHDTTHRSTRYKLICAPFTGMNHHTHNIMFGVGFLLHEDTKSFKWLFEQFLRSMVGKQPITIMTDEDKAMDAAIPQVFHNSRHRLCVWHIGENSKKHIPHLRQEEGFMVAFQNILSCIDTVAEFEYCWGKLCTEYRCGDEKWLKALYEKREKWSRAHNKSFFSGGVVSSQRSETTNNSICRSLPKTARLCDFFKNFTSVVDGWREREREQDFRCSHGRIEMQIYGVSILKHARELYTHEAYLIFEKEYTRINSCSHTEETANKDGVQIRIYRINRNGVDYFGHQVVFYPQSYEVVCTCGLFSEAGFLCTHCLLVYFLNNVKQVPEHYILPRYRRGANMHSVIGSSSCVGTSDFSSSCLWRSDMINKFISLISTAENNDDAKKVIEESFSRSKPLVEALVGACGDDTNGDNNAKDPEKLRPKGERNQRFKSAVEIRSKKAKGKNKKEATERTKKSIWYSMTSANPELLGQYFHPLDTNVDFQVPDLNG